MKSNPHAPDLGSLIERYGEDEALYLEDVFHDAIASAPVREALRAFFRADDAAARAAQRETRRALVEAGAKIGL
jgi:hypothetical protein